MRVQRLDLGVDVVHLPTRDMLVIHPDLEYGEALGAVAKTVPGMHMDAVVAAVEQVTPRPKPARRRAIPRVRLSTALVVTVLSLATGASVVHPAAATMFEETWATTMAGLGLRCDPERADGNVVTCVEEDGDGARVIGHRREAATLYVIRREGPDRCLLIFDTERAAERWSKTRIDAEVTGRVAVLS